MCRHQLFRLCCLLVFSVLVSACATGARTSNPDMPDNAYLDGGNSKVGLILCHGRGKYPTWEVVQPVRIGVHEKLGYHTLSLQMPGSGKDWRAYAYEFPEAYKRIQAGIDFLSNEKGVDKIYLLGHSMGSRMASSFIAKYPQAHIDGFIGVGIRTRGDGVLDANSNMGTFYKRIPILDIFGTQSRKDVRDAEERDFMKDSPNYTRVIVDGAGHRFTGYEDELAQAVVSWLGKQ